MNKKASIDVLNVIFGIIVMIGGVIIIFDRVNLGSLIASIGLVFELIKIVIEKGL